MASCSFCGRSVEGFPYSCNECGETHCARHRLPERHECRGLARVSDRADEDSAFIGRTEEQDRQESGVIARAFHAVLAPLRRLRR
ncbi:zinc finger AN1 domain-containing stress-associated protein [Haloarchaeobius sp. FL176]|uniref:AN1-type zinc finger protein n=1 Tax=Haloarchaeobius sp. FL176 TaxID=2967129 RepID=UPI002147F7EC|nr:zinc finger AN1 domain-containing stress-associated protein [Haloarchaeobius sp. FL176]